MLSITYLSSATRLMSAGDLIEMLEAIRPRNRERGLTGALFYSGGNIIQTLEGPDDVVEQTYAAIESDPRHTGVLEVLRDQISERAFPDWTMGFRDISDVDISSVDGFNAYLQLPVEQGSAAHERVQVMLRVFKRHNP